jgi:hypothetical protein
MTTITHTLVFVQSGDKDGIAYDKDGNKIGRLKRFGAGYYKLILDNKEVQK